MADEKTFTKELRESLENKRMGNNFLGILNDIKRTTVRGSRRIRNF